MVRRARCAKRWSAPSAPKQLGFEAIFFADSQMNNVDPYQALALCAVNTKTLRFGTAVTNMVYRDPTITANSFATLNEISEGRAIIGLGTGDGPVYSLGRTATKLSDFEKGLSTIRDLLHDRGIDVPQSKERPGGNVQAQSRQAPGAHLYLRRGAKNTARCRPDLRRRHSRHRLRQAVTDWARQRIGEGAQDGRPDARRNRYHAGRHDRRRRRRRSWRANACARAWPTARTIIFASRWKPFPKAKRRVFKRFMDNFDISKPIEERVDPDFVTDYLLERFTIAGTPRNASTK